MSHTTKKFLLIVGLLLLVLLMLIPSVYFYYKFQETKEELKVSQSLTQGDVSALVEKVSKLVELPSDEVPTVALIQDVSQLKGQGFFANAENGDQVLVYKGAKKAFLYDPVGNRVREVGPVTLENDPAANGIVTNGSQVAPTTSPIDASFNGLKVALVNGTTTQNVTQSAENRMIAEDLNASVVGRAFAKGGPYTKTFIVDLTGTKGSQLSALARIFNASFQSYPSSEESIRTSLNGADVAVFLGNDFIATSSSSSR